MLLHGAWSDGREWRLQLEGLADEFTVIAWDAPGCGASSDPPEDFRPSDYADAAAGLIHSLDIGRPHVLGMSFGGGLAIEMFRRHPDLPRSLILASAYAGWAGSLPPDVVEARVHRALIEADQPPETWVGSYIPGFFAGPVAQELIDEVTAIMCEVRAAGIKPMVTAFAAADLRDALADIAVPTLLLYGERDERAPLSVAHELHAMIRKSELVVLPGVGHVSNIESPAAFNAEVRRFLKSVPT
ncbi:MAG TPA: alpha/beta hydrolase [Acidimicrobiia bacterium]